jgi:hypothetical protein
MENGYTVIFNFNCFSLINNWSYHKADSRAAIKKINATFFRLKSVHN